MTRKKPGVSIAGKRFQPGELGGESTVLIAAGRLHIGNV